MDNPNNNCVLLFVKSPADGLVKTRLAEKLGDAAAVKLYKSFALDTLDTLRRLNSPFKICFYPDSAQDQISNWLGEKYSYVPQAGRNLGERMKNAFLQTFTHDIDRAILIGSDIPDLPADFLGRALDALESNDAVIGPTSDGGYYLIGFAKQAFLPQAFEQIQWSSPTTFDQTLDALKNHSRTTHILPQWHDLDTLTDLTDFVARNHNTPFRKWKTYSCILETHPQTNQ